MLINHSRNSGLGVVAMDSSADQSLRTERIASSEWPDQTKQKKRACALAFLCSLVASKKKRA